MMTLSLVSNGGMEGGADPPADWIQEANATVVSDSGNKQSGSYGLKVTAGADNVGAYQNVTLITGKYYTISGWIKATAGDSGRILVDTGAGSTITVGTVTATGFTKINRTFRATGTAGVVYLRAVTNTDIVWFDDVAIVELDTVAASTAAKGSGIVPMNNPIIGDEVI